MAHDRLRHLSCLILIVVGGGALGLQAQATPMPLEAQAKLDPVVLTPQGTHQGNSLAAANLRNLGSGAEGLGELGSIPSPLGDSEHPPMATDCPPLDLEASVLEDSPVLQRWLHEVPDMADQIRHSPSFRTRLRVGYSGVPSSGEGGGFQMGVEDVFVWPGTGLTASADYSRSGEGQRETYGAEARYYLLPLGGYGNVAPTLGYRSVSGSTYRSEGLDVGLRLMVIPSRGGGADLALSQHWVAPGTDQEVGLTQVNLGYAVTNHLRIGSDFVVQNSRFGQENRWGLSLEYLL